jgi:hypothetical protein
VTIISAVAAWSARESYRIRLNDLGDPNAVSVPKRDYDRMQVQPVPEAAAYR